MGTMPNIGGYNFPAYGGNKYFNYGSIPSGANPIAGLGLGNADLTKQLTNIFGPIGTTYGNFLSGGAGYNPQVLTALVNQLQPQISSDIATLGSSAGAAGTRYGSGYELGLGDYLSQVNANEMGMAANLYQNSVQNALGVLGGLTSDIFEQRNQPGFGTSFLTSLLSSAAGGIGNILFGGKGGYGGGGGGRGGILGTLISKIPGLGGIGGGGGSNTGITIGGTGDLPPIIPTFPSGTGTGGGGGDPGGLGGYGEGDYLAGLPGLAGQLAGILFPTGGMGQTIDTLQGLGFTGQTGANILGGFGGGGGIGGGTSLIPSLA